MNFTDKSLTKSYTTTIIECVGNTPIVKLQKERWDIVCDIYLKLEYFNPWLSIKDRAATSMILSAEAAGHLGQDTSIIEATTGNTGISLAAICANRGYPLTIVMPDYVSRERMILLTMLGAELKLTPGELGYKETVRQARSLAKTRGAYYIDQGNNVANPAAHRQTGREIWAQMDGKIDFFVAGVGTGGHISGIGHYLRECNPNLHVMAVEPEGAAVLSGHDSIDTAKSTHGVTGIGPGVVFPTTDQSVISSVFVTNRERTYEVARRLIKTEGLLIGVSTGATVHAALEIAKKAENKGKRVLCIAASQTERYLSTGLATEAQTIVDGLISSMV